MMRRALAIVSLLFVVGGCRHENPANDPFGDGGNGNGDGGNGNGDGGFNGMVCATQSAKVSALGADMIFLLDTSYSMDFNLKWTSISQAMLSFINDPRFAGVGVGLQYFPLRSTCDVADYQMLAVPTMPLPGNANALSMSIESKRMAGGTPTVPALEGVLEYATARAQANPDRKQVLVLATDGTPDNSCPAGDGGLSNDIPTAVQLVQQAANAMPSVSTFVVGVGSNLTALNAIAAAGNGYPTAFLVDTTADIQTEFADALDQIRRKALDCEFTIPPTDPGVVVDYNHVNVTFTETTTEPFVFVGDESGCAKAPMSGWYYDDPKNPTKVILCSAACDRVRASADGEVDVVFGCAQLVP